MSWLGMRRRDYLKHAKPEELAAVAFLDWAKLCRYRGHPLDHYLVHIPNEHGLARDNRAKVTRLIKLAMGLRPGVSDYVLPIPVQGYAGLWLELKAGRNRLTQDQIEWRDRMDEEGYAAETAWEASGATRVVRSYLLADELVAGRCVLQEALE